MIVRLLTLKYLIIDKEFMPLNIPEEIVPVLNYVSRHPKCTFNEICEAFPAYNRATVHHTIAHAYFMELVVDIEELRGGRRCHVYQVNREELARVKKLFREIKSK